MSVFWIRTRRKSVVSSLIEVERAFEWSFQLFLRTLEQTLSLAFRYIYNQSGLVKAAFVKIGLDDHSGLGGTKTGNGRGHCDVTAEGAKRSCVVIELSAEAIEEGVVYRSQSGVETLIDLEVLSVPGGDAFLGHVSLPLGFHSLVGFIYA